MREYCSHLRLIAIALGLFLVASPCARAGDLQEHLREQYQGKTRLLRGFYVGDHLRYDSAGVLIGRQFAGDWTADGFVVLDDIHESGPLLVIETRRLLVTRLTPEFAFSAAKKRSAEGKDLGAALLTIKVDFGKVTPSAEQADSAISRIFLTEQDNLADLVPEYWRSCVRDGLDGKNQNCRFSNEVLSIPGVVLSNKNLLTPIEPDDASQPVRQDQIFHVGKGVRPPKAIFQPEPEFSEGARGVKYQGRAVLGLIVSAEGKPTKIRILNPLGAGLDAKAVHAVESWKFEPAKLEGQPVPVEIAVEVDFHLY